jgi:hypothetical protein
VPGVPGVWWPHGGRLGMLGRTRGAARKARPAAGLLGALGGVAGGGNVTHEFRNDLPRGERGEEVIREYLARRGLDVRSVTLTEQRRGIDLVYSIARTVEVKTDGKAHETGNAAIELVSNDRTGKPGWAYTCEADWLAYYIPADGRVFWLRPDVVRAELDRWQRAHRSFSAPNPGYNTTGVLVPLAEIERIAEQVVTL